ncbi:hypothetical protein [Flavobacterium marginilacus]|uniref:hypothetical protein n=1 Tax=Flavobacterium marginilacus TaxID=3003256 RepID=UPI00248F1F45|nr:hypothetical protein [Flavobacterium marginilacus]
MRENSVLSRMFCILLSSLFLISCENSTQIKEIEILTYFDNARDFQTYSSINKNGFAETLFKSETSKKIDNCQMRIRKSLLDSIIAICKNKNDEDFIFKNSKQILYCGLSKNIRITYENRKTITFAYPSANNENKQFFLFQSLLKQIQNDSLKATRLNLNQIGKICTKQEEFSNIIFKKDSIFLMNYLKK